MLKPIYDNIPQELKDFPQWVNWKLITRKEGDKPTKPPYHPSGRLAESNNPLTWCNFLPVKTAANQFDGIGFVLTKDDPFVGLDFDKCRCPAFDSLDSELSSGLNMVLPDVADYVRKLNSYTEESPSGKGIRILLKGNLPVDGRKKGDFEVYQSGRYVTVTGHVLDGFPRTIEPRQKELDAFYQEVFGATPKPILLETKPRPDARPLGDWKPLVEKALQSANGQEIQRLWEGDYSCYASQSEADLALCSHLAFWLAGDAGAIDAAFRESGLFREKWDDKHHSDGSTYGETTIQKAVAGCTSFYGDRQENHHDSIIQRLATLTPLQYDQVRIPEAKALRIRPATLDAAVKDLRKSSDKDNLPFVKTDTWPEPVDPAQLLTDIAATIQRFIVCNEEVAHTTALWAAMTWFIDDIQVAPLAVITAPEKRCGKTLLLSLLGKLSARSVTASSISSSALFRSIDKWQPTLLIDEADAFMKDNEELRGLLNCGHTRDSAYVIRTVGDNFTPTKFNAWGAKALAGIGHVADTLMDRAVILELRRKLPDEKVHRIRTAETGLFDELRSKLARFAEDYSEHVREARPPLPDSLNDRAQDNWEPLLAIAMTAGEEWLRTATKAALKLSGGEIESQTIGTELLSDIQDVFEEKRVDRITTAELLATLCADDEKPWKTYNKGKELAPRQLANRLKAYGIHSKTIRINLDTAKGYERDQFAESFSRYVHASPSASVTTSQSTAVLDLRAFPSVTPEDVVTDRNQWKPTLVKECDGVTDENPQQAEIVLTEDDLQGVSL